MKVRDDLEVKFECILFKDESWIPIVYKTFAENKNC